MEVKQDFEVPKGDDVWLYFDIDPATLETATLTGCEIIFKISLFENLGPDPDNVLLTKSSVDDAAEFEILDASAMQYRVKLRKDDMADWDPGIYYHQTQVKDTNDEYVTTTTGTGWILETV